MTSIGSGLSATVRALPPRTPVTTTAPRSWSGDSFLASAGTSAGASGAVATGSTAEGVVAGAAAAAGGVGAGAAGGAAFGSGGVLGAALSLGGVGGAAGGGEAGSCACASPPFQQRTDNSERAVSEVVNREWRRGFILSGDLLVIKSSSERLVSG